MRRLLAKLAFAPHRSRRTPRISRSRQGICAGAGLPGSKPLELRHLGHSPVPSWHSPVSENAEPILPYASALLGNAVTPPIGGPPRHLLTLRRGN
ncbi:hypothetical protein MPL3356_70335 [Mesorhizobium plurifarium]|uniref:Uncharacterized protein n=1 Tax=Mesorhizobium plurifarium TaxID=69974 RepID=A0A090EI73_MESPL|nr:hypothetical protein MPL3356_70335 [Mesorhizobium plurifarium]